VLNCSVLVRQGFNVICTEILMIREIRNNGETSNNLLSSYFFLFQDSMALVVQFNSGIIWHRVHIQYNDWKFLPFISFNRHTA
jgi:hypothetical protein